jgi:hypothetical protein
MKKLIFLFLFLSNLTFSQEFDLTFSDEIMAGRKYAVDHILGKIDGNIYTTRSEYGILTKSKFDIRKYDSNFNLVFKKELTLPKDDFVKQSTILRNDTIFAFLSHYDKDQDINYLYGSTISKEGTIKLPLVELAAIEADNKRRRNYYLISENTDSTGFIVTVTPEYKMNEEKNVQFILLDHQYKNLDQVNLDLPYTHDDLEILEAKATPEGNIHILAGIKVDVGERRKENTLRILTYYKDKKELHEHEIDLDLNYITEYKLKFRKNGNLILSGFYSDHRMSSMKGIYFIEIDTKKRSFVNMKTTDFTTDFLKLFISERKAEKGRELWHFKVRGIYIKDDGGIMFLAEHFHQYSTNFESTDKRFKSSSNVVTTNTGGRSSTNYYDYGDIMVADMNSEGKINWWTKIPKLQNTTNDNGVFGGINHSFRNNSIYMIFNDHEKNINHVDPAYLRNLKMRKSWAVLVTINSKGEAKKTPLFNSKKKKVYLIPKAGYKVNDNELIIMAGTKRHFRFCQVSFK